MITDNKKIKYLSSLVPLFMISNQKHLYKILQFFRTINNIINFLIVKDIYK